jgi:acyl carrier protein
MNIAATSAHVSAQEDRIKHLPAGARTAFQRYLASGDPTGIDPMILAILADYIPRSPSVPLDQLPGNTQLIDDLGFDSLAITEVVFFTEDVFGISISNSEIVQVRTLDDLRSFIRAKLTARAR